MQEDTTLNSLTDGGGKMILDVKGKHNVCVSQLLATQCIMAGLNGGLSRCSQGDKRWPKS
jgi:hypothetical protein